MQTYQSETVPSLEYLVFFNTTMNLKFSDLGQNKIILIQQIVHNLKMKKMGGETRLPCMAISPTLAHLAKQIPSDAVFTGWTFVIQCWKLCNVKYAKDCTLFKSITVCFSASLNLHNSFSPSKSGPIRLCILGVDKSTSLGRQAVRHSRQCHFLLSGMKT